MRCSGYSTQLRGLCSNGPSVFGAKPANASPRKCPPFTTAWRSTDGTENRARLAGRRSRGLSTRITRRTTARAARPVGGSSPTAHCRACCAETGRARSRRWKGCTAAEAAARPKTPRHRYRLSARAHGSAYVGVVPLQPFAKAEPPARSDLEVDPVRPQRPPGGDPAIGGDYNAVDEAGTAEP